MNPKIKQALSNISVMDFEGETWVRLKDVFMAVEFAETQMDNKDTQRLDKLQSLSTGYGEGWIGMRIIKFRGKRIDNGEWVYGSLVNNLWFKREDKTPIQQIICPTDNYSCWEDLNEDGEGIYDVDPMTVGQFTGLLDKNGKEIYEGDICINEVAKWEVVFNKGCFSGKWTRDYRSEPTDHIALRAIIGIEVIGNIHENPERSDI